MLQPLLPRPSEIWVEIYQCNDLRVEYAPVYTGIYLYQYIPKRYTYPARRVNNPRDCEPAVDHTVVRARRHSSTLRGLMFYSQIYRYRSRDCERVNQSIFAPGCVAVNVTVQGLLRGGKPIKSLSSLVSTSANGLPSRKLFSLRNGQVLGMWCGIRVSPCHFLLFQLLTSNVN